MPDTINTAIPHRRYSRPYAITLSDTLADRNLQRNGIPFLFLQNVGTSGLVMIAWEPDGTLVDVYLSQGQILELGLPRHAKATGGTAVGVSLRGFMGAPAGVR